jgi:hypothetical protein
MIEHTVIHRRQLIVILITALFTVASELGSAQSQQTPPIMSTPSTDSSGTTRTGLVGWYPSSFIKEWETNCAPNAVEVRGPVIGVDGGISSPRTPNTPIAVSISQNIPKYAYVSANPSYKWDWPVSSYRDDPCLVNEWGQQISPVHGVTLATFIEAPGAGVSETTGCQELIWAPPSNYSLPTFNYSWQFPAGTQTITATMYFCRDGAPTGDVAGKMIAQFEVMVPPQLSLFLDVDGIDLANPITTDDSSWYNPCSSAGGSSITPTQLPQTVTVVAAYLNSSNAIVTPPIAGDARLVLSKVSAFQGVAMNASIASRIDSDPDFDTPTGSFATAPFGADKTARFAVRCWDYGGFADVTALHGPVGNENTASMHLPRDVGFNGIPDEGWLVPDAIGGYYLVPDSFQVASDDNDSNYDPAIPNNFPGDGLSRFEEYRGFIVKGVHVRTDPDKKDLFIWSQFTNETIGDARTLPLIIHEINVTEWTGSSTRLIASKYASYGHPLPSPIPGEIPGHFHGTWPTPTGNWLSDQRAAGVFIDTIKSSVNDGFGVTENAGSLPGPPWVVGPGGSKVHQNVVRMLSPTRTQTNRAENIDSPKYMQTIAHEVGHSVGMQDRPKMPNYSCNPPDGPATTVMVTLYFPVTNPGTTPNCQWNNIPHVYEPTDLAQLRVK